MADRVKRRHTCSVSDREVNVASMSAVAVVEAVPLERWTSSQARRAVACTSACASWRLSATVTKSGLSVTSVLMYGSTACRQ